GGGGGGGGGGGEAVGGGGGQGGVVGSTAFPPRVAGWLTEPGSTPAVRASAAPTSAARSGRLSTRMGLPAPAGKWRASNCSPSTEPWAPRNASCAGTPVARSCTTPSPSPPNTSTMTA